jgi:hypothetical protein
MPPDQRQHTPPAASLVLDTEALGPLVRQIVAEVLGQMGQAKATIPEKLAFPEAEAARLLSLRPHQLRDERLRGRIRASAGPGRKVLYVRQGLVDYLVSRRQEGR